MSTSIKLTSVRGWLERDDEILNWDVILDYIKEDEATINNLLQKTSNDIDSLVKCVDKAEAKIRELESLLRKGRRCHDVMCEYSCDCGADEWNAQVDELLSKK